MVFTQALAGFGASPLIQLPLEGLLIPIAPFPHAFCYYITEGGEQVDCSPCVRSHIEINLGSFTQMFCRCPNITYPPTPITRLSLSHPFCHSLSFRLPLSPLFSLAFHPSLRSTALLTSAARKPSVLLSATNRRRQIKKHHSS